MIYHQTLHEYFIIDQDFILLPFLIKIANIDDQTYQE